MKQDLPKIKNKTLLQQALSHRSYVNEHPTEGQDNERLEFLGDAVLSFVVGALLYRRYPDISEAKLTCLRSALVDEKQLANFAREIGIGPLMKLGKGADKDGGRDNPALLSDMFEALIGAYFLDAGIEEVQQYIEPFLSALADALVHSQTEAAPQHLVDSKNRFQQWALARFKENPIYTIIDEAGPAHAKEFIAQVSVKGTVYGEGRDRRKQEAEKRAAESALKNVELESKSVRSRAKIEEPRL